MAYNLWKKQVCAFTLHNVTGIFRGNNQVSRLATLSKASKLLRGKLKKVLCTFILF